jgi:hypothetical protein
MTLHLGKRSPVALKLQLHDYLVPAGLPTPPAIFGDLLVYETGTPKSIEWGVLGNTQCGDCVFAGFAHQAMLWKATNGTRFTPTSAMVIADYSAATGYNPADPKTDLGTDVLSGCEYWRTKGIILGGVSADYIAGYVASNYDPDSLALAAYLFGSVGIGLQLPDYSLDQFTEQMPWTYVANPKAKSVGGHYVPIIGRNSSGYFLCVTWGRLQAIHPQFLVQYVDEAAICLSQDWISATSQKSPRGILYDQLQADLSTLGVPNG